MGKDLIIDGVMDQLGCDRGVAEEYVDQFFAWTPEEVIEDMDEFDIIEDIVETANGEDEP